MSADFCHTISLSIIHLTNTPREYPTQANTKITSSPAKRLKRPKTDRTAWKGTPPTSATPSMTTTYPYPASSSPSRSPPPAAISIAFLHMSSSSHKNAFLLTQLPGIIQGPINITVLISIPVRVSVLPLMKLLIFWST